MIISQKYINFNGLPDIDEYFTVKLPSKQMWNMYDRNHQIIQDGLPWEWSYGLLNHPHSNHM